MKELERVLREAGSPQMDKLIQNESLLIPAVLLYQRTLRLAGLVPTWTMFSSTPIWHTMFKNIEFEGRKKFKAWWTLIFEVQRYPDDKASVILALAYVVQEQLRRQHNTHRPVGDSAKMGLTEAQATIVRDRVLTHYDFLMPQGIHAGADLAALVRPKFQRGK